MYSQYYLYTPKCLSKLNPKNPIPQSLTTALKGYPKAIKKHKYAEPFSPNTPPSEADHLPLKPLPVAQTPAHSQNIQMSTPMLKINISPAQTHPIQPHTRFIVMRNVQRS